LIPTAEASILSADTERSPMDHARAQDWLDRYVAAWRSNDADLITPLFAADVTYRFYPHGDPVVGRDAVVASWLDDPDDPESWDAHYAPYAVDGNRVVATGESRYFAHDDQAERVYHNCYLIEFDDDGRCRAFTEYYVKVP
jgi:hypothetical protein